MSAGDCREKTRLERLSICTADASIKRVARMVQPNEKSTIHPTSSQYNVTVSLFFWLILCKDQFEIRGELFHSSEVT